MLNIDKVVSSTEKYESHKRINNILEKWIGLHFFSDAKVITMPANSGRQESYLLELFSKLEKQHMREGSIRLYTFDRTYNAWETGITLAKEYHHYWKHEVCRCIFEEVALFNNGLKAAWFDLTGGLTDKTMSGLSRAIRRFSHGSLLFTTLQIHGVRALVSGEYARSVYDSYCSSLESKTLLTDSLLKQIALENGKYIRSITEPYVYQRNTVTYAVFFHIIGEIK